MSACARAARFSEIARELRYQLLITYARPQSAKATGKLEISATRRGIKVRGPKEIC